MRINSNIAALNTLNKLGKNENATKSSLAKLSSGLRINSAADDAAGLAISEKMKGQIRGLDQASSNSEDGISLVQTAEGALGETESILQRMRELSVQSSSDTNTDDDRDAIQDEMNQLTKEIDRISSTTQFNTKNLLDGSMSNEVTTALANVQGNMALTASGGATGVATDSTLTGLADSDGNSLNIVSGDKVTISYMKDGALVNSSIDVVAGTDVADIFNTVSDITLSDGDGTNGVASGGLVASASAAGTSSAVYGLTITVTDSEGDEKSGATAALSSFSEVIAAKDTKTTDGRATLQIGANTSQTMSLEIGDMGATALGVANLDVSSQDAAAVAISVIDEATAKVSAQRSSLGAVQNRLEHTINNLDTASENLSSAQSQIADVDMAAEMMEYTKNNVLTQAAQAMLAQANQQPQQVLSLLQ